MVREEDAAALVVVVQHALAVRGYDPVITHENGPWLVRYAGLMLAGFGITGRETTEDDG